LAWAHQVAEVEDFISLEVALNLAMSMIGICNLCGRPANTTCPLCGRLVCTQCSNPVTRVCRACSAKQMKTTRAT